MYWQVMSAKKFVIRCLHNGRIIDNDRLFKHLVKWMVVAGKDKYNRPEE